MMECHHEIKTFEIANNSEMLFEITGDGLSAEEGLEILRYCSISRSTKSRTQHHLSRIPVLYGLNASGRSESLLSNPV